RLAGREPGLRPRPAGAILASLIVRPPAPMSSTAEIQIPPRVRETTRGDTLPHGRALLRDPAVALLLLVPLALLAIDPRWIYSPIHRDSWIYWGYFQNASTFAWKFPDQYFSSRLSVILPGHLLHRLLPLEAANHVLHLTAFWAALLSFYGVCASWLDRRRALLAALALGCHPFFLNAIGWNYVDGFGITYFLATLFLLTAALRSRHRSLCLVLAGAGATALVTANAFYGIYLPFLAAYFLLFDRGPGRRPLLSSIALTLAGAAGLFLVFGTVNRIMGGPFFYLAPSLSFIGGRVQTANPFRDPTYSWVPGATRLVLTLLILAGGAAVLALRRREADPARRRFAVFTQLQLLGLAGLLVFCQVKADMAVLQHLYYVSLLLPAVFFAFAAQLPPGLAGMKPRTFALLFGAAAGILGLSHALAFAPGSTVSWRPDLPVLAPLVAGGLLVVLPWLNGLATKGAAAWTLGTLMSLAICQLLAWEPSNSGQGFSRFGGDTRGAFRQVAQASALIDSRDPALGIRLWYTITPDDSNLLADMVSSTFLVCPSMVGGNFPALIFGAVMCDGTPLVAGQRIAVLSTDPAAFDQADRSLRGVGLAARLLERQEIAGPVPGFAVTFLEAVPAAGAP
ncbi:MAG TPA: hypothetical protein VEL74_24820, partial [Thermoanaerobaculia bacterium]|nr:hypothetical protein [Thermoanaerobaculia bacterium]